MPGRKYEPASGYRSGFNGKEKDNDLHYLTAYDYGFRIYNPAIGKFLSVDPLTKSYPWYSPFHFGGNNPIHNIDMDGLEECGYGQKLENQWIPALMSGKMTEAQFERNKMAFSIGGGGGLAVVATVYTGGKAGPLIAKLASGITLYHVVSAYPHNSAPTPEGRAQQIKDSKEHLANAFMFWGSGEIFGIVGKGAKSFSEGVAKYMSGSFTIGPKTLAKVTEHLKQFGKHAENEVMIADMKKIVSGEMKATEIHINFAKHELREAELMKNGLSPDKAHEAVLKEQGMYHKDYDKKLYTTEALKAGNEQMLKEAIQK